jgi:hypothetical protein
VGKLGTVTREGRYIPPTTGEYCAVLKKVMAKELGGIGAPSTDGELRGFLAGLSGDELLLAVRWAEHLPESFRFGPKVLSLSRRATSPLDGVVVDRVLELYRGAGVMDNIPKELRYVGYSRLNDTLRIIGMALGGGEVEASYWKILSRQPPKKLARIVLDLYLLIEGYRALEDGEKETTLVLAGELDESGVAMLMTIGAVCERAGSCW